MAKPKKQHYANGLISEYRNDAKKADLNIVKKAVKESKKVNLATASLFSKVTAKKTKKLLSFC